MGILKGRNCSVRSTCERWMTVDCERRNSCLRHRRHSPTCVCAPGHREFSAGHQPCRWPGSSAFCPHTLSGLLPRPSLFSQPLFSILHTHRHHLHLFHPYNSTATGVCTCIGSLSLATIESFSEAISHSFESRIPPPTINSIARNGQQPAGTGKFSFCASVARKQVAHPASSQPRARDSKFYCPPSFSALPESPLDRQIA